MFVQKEYLLVTIDTRSASRIVVVDLGTAKPEPTGGPIDFGPGGLGRTQGLSRLTPNILHFSIQNGRFKFIVTQRRGIAWILAVCRHRISSSAGTVCRK
jgi:hypothetical protein